MRLPQLPPATDLLAFVADLQSRDWKLGVCIRRALQRNPQLRPVDAIVLVCAFALLTGQDAAFDVYGVDDDDEAPVATLYGTPWGFKGSGTLERYQVLLPDTRIAYIEATQSLLPENVRPWRMQDVFSDLLAESRFEDAAELAAEIFL